MNILGLFASIILTGGVASTPVILKEANSVTRAQSYNYTRSDANSRKNYYASIASGTSKDEAFDKLETLLKSTHTRTRYNSGSSMSYNWDGYYLFERDFERSPLTSSERDGKYKKSGIWLNVLYCASPIYISSDIGSNKTYKYIDSNGNEKSGTMKQNVAYVNREHIFSKSHGMNSEAYPYDELDCGTDIHNLHMSDEINNERHSSYPYAELTTYTGSKQIMDNFTGTVSGYVGQHDGFTVYEPIEKDKGIIARSIFYMALRYHTFDDSSSLQPRLGLTNNLGLLASVKPEDTKDSPAYYGHLDTLLKWNKEHPVTEAELYRNDLICNNFQHNRNPFVDYPHWADFFFNPNYEALSDGLSYVIPPEYEKGSEAEGYKVTIDRKEGFSTSLKVGDTLDASWYEARVLDYSTGNYVVNPEVTYKLNGEAISGNVVLSKEGTNELVATYIDGANNSFTGKISFDVGAATTPVDPVTPSEPTTNASINPLIIIAIGVGAFILLLIILLAVVKNKNAAKAIPKSTSSNGFENKVLKNKQIKNIKKQAKKNMNNQSSSKKKKK